MDISGNRACDSLLSASHFPLDHEVQSCDWESERLQTLRDEFSYWRNRDYQVLLFGRDIRETGSLCALSGMSCFEEAPYFEGIGSEFLQKHKLAAVGSSLCLDSRSGKASEGLNHLHSHASFEHAQLHGDFLSHSGTHHSLSIIRHSQAIPSNPSTLTNQSPP